MNEKTKAILIVVIVVATILTIVTVAAVIYQLQNSNVEHVTVDETVISVPLTLTVSSNTLNEGGMLTVTVKAAAAAGQNVDGFTVYLYEDDISIDSDALAWDGTNCKAIFIVYPSIGGHDYQAKPS